MMLDAEEEAHRKLCVSFLDFLGDLDLVSFNADFDIAFLQNAAAAFDHHQQFCFMRPENGRVELGPRTP